MTWLFGRAERRYEILHWWEGSTGVRLSVESSGHALDLLRPLSRDTGTVARMRRLLSETWPAGTVSRWSDDEVLRFAAREMARGNLAVFRVELPPLGARDGEGELEPAKVEERAAVPHETPWIEVELTEEDGTPVAGEPYAITAPDGSTRQGRLDKEGFARIEGIAEGDYQVWFPERDRTDFDPRGDTLGAPRWTAGGEAEKAPSPRYVGSAWIEIELVDESGAFVAGEPYVVELPDGSVRAGALDDLGRALLLDVPEGVYRVSFPERDALDLQRTAG